MRSFYYQLRPVWGTQHNFTRHCYLSLLWIKWFVKWYSPIILLLTIISYSPSSHTHHHFPTHHHLIHLIIIIAIAAAVAIDPLKVTTHGKSHCNATWHYRFVKVNGNYNDEDLVSQDDNMIYMDVSIVWIGVVSWAEYKHIKGELGPLMSNIFQPLLPFSIKEASFAPCKVA